MNAQKILGVIAIAIPMSTGLLSCSTTDDSKTVMPGSEPMEQKQQDQNVSPDTTGIQKNTDTAKNDAGQRYNGGAIDTSTNPGRP